MPRTINKAGLALIQAHEGLRLTAYDDLQPKKKLRPGDQLKGTLTIGYGHTGPDVAIGQVITKAEAAELLKADLREAEADVEGAIAVTMTDNEFAALVSLAFNIGGPNLRKSSVRRKLNAGDRLGAAEAFKLWNKSKGQVLAGLVRRRAEEAALFLTPTHDARRTATATPDDVKAGMAEGDKVATGAAAGGGVIAAATTAAKEASEWTWGLPEYLGTAVLLLAVGAAVWLWWRRRRPAKA